MARHRFDRPGQATKSRVLLLTLVLATMVPAAHALDLLQGYRLALTQDATYQASRAETAAARESTPQAIAQMLPNVSGSMTRTQNNTDSEVPGFPPGTLSHGHSEYFSSSYVISLHQPIYRKYNFAQYQQAKSQVTSAEASLEKNLQDLLVRLAGSYFEALMAQDQIVLIQAQKEAYSLQLKATKRALETGLGTRTDIDDAQARYDMVLAQELEASQNLDYTRRQLSVIVNQPVNELSALVPERMQLAPPIPASAEEWITRGEDVNPELRAMRANIESAKQELEKVKAGHRPTVDLIAQRSRSQSANDTTINQLYLTSMVGLQVNVPLFAGGYVDSQERQALASIDRYQNLYEARRREVDQQIRKEFQNVAEGVLKVRALEQAERSAYQAVFSNQKGFQAGTRTLVDILNAQQQRVNASRDLAQQRYLYLMARVRLQGLVNSLDENEITLINSWLSSASVATPSLALREK